MIYQIKKRKPGETFEDYLKRNKAHPSQPDRRSATAEEEALFDVTYEYVGRGFILGKGATPAKPKRTRKAARGPAPIQKSRGEKS